LQNDISASEFCKFTDITVRYLPEKPYLCPQNINITHYGFDNFNGYRSKLPPLHGTLDEQQTLASRPSLRGSDSRRENCSHRRSKNKLTEKEKDELFFSVAGAWKDDPIGDEMLEAIRIGRQPASYERKLAYFEEDE